VVKTRRRSGNPGTNNKREKGQPNSSHGVSNPGGGRKKGHNPTGKKRDLSQNSSSRRKGGGGVKKKMARLTRNRPRRS